MRRLCNYHDCLPYLYSVQNYYLHIILSYHVSDRVSKSGNELVRKAPSEPRPAILAGFKGDCPRGAKVNVLLKSTGATPTERSLLSLLSLSEATNYPGQLRAGTDHRGDYSVLSRRFSRQGSRAGDGAHDCSVPSCFALTRGGVVVEYCVLRTPEGSMDENEKLTWVRVSPMWRRGRRVRGRSIPPSQ